MEINNTLNNDKKSKLSDDCVCVQVFYIHGVIEKLA